MAGWVVVGLLRSAACSSWSLRRSWSSIVLYELLAWDASYLECCKPTCSPLSPQATIQLQSEVCLFVAGELLDLAGVADTGSLDFHLTRTARSVPARAAEVEVVVLLLLSTMALVGEQAGLRSSMMVSGEAEELSRKTGRTVYKTFSYFTGGIAFKTTSASRMLS